ncbi:unnamed protein product [Rhizophagus irregularis]|nr:unnamed protein product [Rhizophagus irregularis]CAB5378933.1 unnamed protein product [Rhizophagus irregularis]
MFCFPFEITEISSEGFKVQVLGKDFIFVKNDNDLVVFEGEEKTIDGEVMILIPNDDTTHIDYDGTKIYFDRIFSSEIQTSIASSDICHSHYFLCTRTAIN